MIDPTTLKITFDAIDKRKAFYRLDIANGFNPDVNERRLFAIAALDWLTDDITATATKMAGHQSPFNDSLNRAMNWAMHAHDHQTDKAGAPYILHPLRVMMQFSDPDHMITAVLHDTVEDSSVTVEHIRKAFGDTIADAVDHLTKRPGEAYMAFITRCASNPIARAVKMADISDNLRPDRVEHLSASERKRLGHKYHHARIQLKGYDQ